MTWGRPAAQLLMRATQKTHLVRMEKMDENSSYTYQNVSRGDHPLDVDWGIGKWAPRNVTNYKKIDQYLSKLFIFLRIPIATTRSWNPVAKPQ